LPGCSLILSNFHFRHAYIKGDFTKLVTLSVLLCIVE
jgi:hypothetical protein